MLRLILDLLGVRRRRPARLSIPAITLMIEGKAYETENWSISGFRLDKFKRSLTVGDQIRGQIGPLGYSHGGGFTASVVRLTDGAGFGACWSDIDREVYVAMSSYG